MDPRLLVHNRHRDGVEVFRQNDPHLRRLAQRPLLWEAPLLDRLPRGEPGIYTLGGARQVGKSTLLKQWMLRLLEAGTPAPCVTFLTAELADDYRILLRWIEEVLEAAPPGAPTYVLVDEVTYVDRWDRAVKFLADAGGLEGVVLVLTGSDLGLLRDMRTFLPGRRGRAAVADFHLHPLTWLETAELKGSVEPGEREALADEAAFDGRSLGPDGWARCRRALDEFLVHGGFLTALNDFVEEGTIRPSTLAIYGDWIRGDVLKRGKSEAYLREVLGALVRRLGSQVTWNALARDLSIDHPATVAAYVDLLQRMDALYVQHALQEKGLTAAPKKARKLVPVDPFVLHAVRHWLDPSVDPYGESILPFLEDPERSGPLVETVVVEHARRALPCFYLKQPLGEVDLAVVVGRRVHPIEVKWRRQLRHADLKGLARLSRGVVAAPVEAVHVVEGVTVIPLARVLALLGRGRWPPAEG